MTNNVSIKKDWVKRDGMIAAIEGVTGPLCTVHYDMIDTEELEKIADAILNDPNKVW